MDGITPLCDRGGGDRDCSFIKKGVQTGTGCVDIRRRKITDFLELGDLAQISLSELALIKADEFCGLAFILPSVTVSSVRGDRKEFCEKASEEYFLWHRTLRARIGNRGLRVMKKRLTNYQVKVLFSGIWVVNGKTYLLPGTGVIKRICS